VARHRTTTLLGLALLVLAATTSACGLAKRRPGRTVVVSVTRDFGTAEVGTAIDARPAKSLTALTAAATQLPVVRVPGDGARTIGGASAGAGTRWYAYVNGVQTTGTAPIPVFPGDTVWWDLHDRHAAGVAPAVVGSFPEPFLHGIGGKQLPVTLQCADDVQRACRRVAAALTAAGVPVALQGLGTGSGSSTLGIVVGVWSELTGQLDAALIAHGPSASGVYARFSGPASRTLELLDPRGRVARTLTGSAGLVAATRDKISQPTWLVTGTDAAGVLAAASAVEPARLHDRFALAVQHGTDLPVPIR
jgi:hypothetical protein